MNLSDIRLLISRYPWPNASCLGDGTLVFNIGLIRRLENEEQAAFVICHELAHYYLNHVNNNVKSHYEFLHSKELKKEINQIKRSEYNQYQRAKELLKGLVYDDRRHSRLHEESADSLGVIFMKNSKYDVAHALSALQILDEIDEDKFGMSLHLEEYFNFESYPFRERWLEKEGGLSSFGSSDNDTDWDSDSLKTHPECEKRIQVLSSIVDRKEVEKNADSKFEYYVQLSDFEIIQSKYDFGSFGSCIYHALQLLQKYPDHAYLENMVAKCLVNITQAQLNHEFSKCVEKPHSRQHKEYELFLNFLQNLRLRELSLISYHYIQREATAEYLKNEDFLFSALLAAHQAKMEDAFNAYKKQYKTQFPKGEYNQIIQNL